MPDAALKSQIQQLRYRMYSVIMAIGAGVYALNIAMGIVWNASWLELSLWAFMLVVNCVVWFQTYHKKHINYRNEVILFTLTTLQIAQGVVLGVVLRGQSAEYTISATGAWFIVLYIFAFFVFPKWLALVVSLLIYTFSAVMTLVALRPESNAPITQMVNYFLACIFVMIFGYAASLWRDYYETMRESAESAEVLAHTDLLTGARNRRALESLLEEEVTRAERHGRDLSILLFDLDNFKNINDTYGHIQGDDVLKRVASIVKQQLRQSDELGRWGGEEFMVMCPETDIAQACFIAERLREAIAEADWEGLTVTVSFGIARKQESELPGSLYERADQALYAAKRAGRNCVKVAGVAGTVRSGDVFVDKGVGQQVS
jgi:diguanylate cyclase (GGDEF)-like protein